ncbi:hypothetical protein, partial [Acinetobacter baumannii]|uniref:hypothetical protein n=1 Tax=Acinetobacter baumannii TaxID=470 RepID=UPI00148F2408
MSLKDNISTYSELKEQMSKCFGKLEDANISSAQLSSIAQEKDESFVQFGQRIRQIAVKAYPNMPNITLEGISKNAFIRGCNDKRAVEL